MLILKTQHYLLAILHRANDDVDVIELGFQPRGRKRLIHILFISEQSWYD